MARGKPRLTRRYRYEVAARVALALLGGFLWVSTFGAFCVALFVGLGWMPEPQAVHVMTLFSFVAWVALAMWVFQHPRLVVLTAWIGGSSLLFYGLFVILQ